MSNNLYNIELGDQNQLFKPMFERRPSSVVRYRHGGYNALFPIKIEGILMNLLSEIPNNPLGKTSKKSNQTTNQTTGAKIIPFPRTANGLYATTPRNKRR